MVDVVQCPVCLQIYVDPQLLIACGHTFCRVCIESLLQRTCPLCRSPITQAGFDPILNLPPIPITIDGRNGFRPNVAVRMYLQDVASSDAMALASNSDQTIIGVQIDGNEPTNALGKLTSFEEQKLALGDNVDAPFEPATSIEHGLPWGLLRQLREEDAEVALRIFLLDNSESTSVGDGRKLVMADPDGLLACTRWEETKNMALQQAELNAILGTTCEFVLLNPPPRPAGSVLRHGIDFVRISPEAAEGVEAQCAELRRMLEKTQPWGLTPLAERIGEIHARVAQEKDELARAGQRVVLIVATDGLPTGSQAAAVHPTDAFVQALRNLSSDLPVNIVIRLTTQEDDVSDFYNKVDAELDFPLDVLEDIFSEAVAVWRRGNGWLTYSPAIHMVRECGTSFKLFDLLDERCLAAAEAMLLARMLLQEDRVSMLVSDAEDFCNCVAERLNCVPLVYCPLYRKMVPCMNLSALRSRVMPLSQRLFACCPRRRRQSKQRKHNAPADNVLKSNSIAECA